MRQYNKRFPYIGPKRQGDDTIDTFFSSVKYHDSTTTVEIIFGTNAILADIYAIGSKSGLKIAKVIQDRFHECGITINICSNNAQEDFTGSVRKLLHAYGVGSNKYEAHKQNRNPDEHLI